MCFDENLETHVCSKASISDYHCEILGFSFIDPYVFAVSNWKKKEEKLIILVILTKSVDNSNNIK